MDVQIAAGAVIADALLLARARLTHENSPLAAAIDWEEAKVGVFGEQRERSAALRDGDRVEIYRPLLIDPKESRRRRARR